MNRESLMLALSDIDDKYIAEADAVRSKSAVVKASASQTEQKSKRTFAIGGLCAVCAVFVLVLGLTLPVALPNRSGGNAGGGTGAKDPHVMHGLHSVVHDYWGSITFADMTEYSITLEFDIKRAYHELNAEVTGDWDVTILAITEKDGQFDKRFFLTDNSKLEGIKRLDGVIVTVNGEQLQNSPMPFEVGKYTVVFDFSEVTGDYTALHLLYFEIRSHSFKLS